MIGRSAGLSPDQKRAERRAACKAFDAMVRARPLKPPPLPREMGRVRSVGAIELEREKRLGLHSVYGLYVHD